MLVAFEMLLIYNSDIGKIWIRILKNKLWSMRTYYYSFKEDIV
jgi:hypothetical protein